MIDIKFNVPPYVDKAADYIQECVKNQKICGDGEYTKKCNAWIEERTGTGKCLLTTSVRMRRSWQRFCVISDPEMR